MRRLPILTALLAVVAGLVALLGPVLVDAPSAAADQPASVPANAQIGGAESVPGFAAVVKVSGLLDPVLVDFVETSIRDAELGGAVALIMQVNSTGVVVSDEAFVGLLRMMRASSVPIGVWVGPSGSHLTGTAAQLVGAADQVGMAPGTRLGNTGAPLTNDLDLARLAPIQDRTVGSSEASDLGITTVSAPTIGDFLINNPGVVTKEITNDNGETRREPVTQVQFAQLSLFSQLMHTVASPAVAYLLITVGLALIIFELFTAGVGVAGVVGAGCVVLAGYGLWVLPTRWWALALLCISMVAFAIDVQTGVPRVWTGIGLVLYVVASLTLFDGLSLSWITVVVAVIAVALAFIGGMPSMVRTRFATPTIGREWMIGEMGRAVTAISPDGVVQVRDALWRASTNRATPIDELDRVRVVGIDGLVLEVEPESGGARDYRDRSGRSGRSGGAADVDGAEGSSGPSEAD